MLSSVLVSVKQSSFRTVTETPSSRLFPPWKALATETQQLVECSVVKVADRSLKNSFLLALRTQLFRLTGRVGTSQRVPGVQLAVPMGISRELRFLRRVISVNDRDACQPCGEAGRSVKILNVNEGAQKRHLGGHPLRLHDFW